MLNDNFYENIGKRIKEQRILCNFTQQELAEKAGITLNHLGKIEVAYSKPSLNTLIQIANALNITISDLSKF